MWTRTCPVCGHDLQKPSVTDNVRCVCGWVWLAVKEKDEETYDQSGEDR